MVLRRRLAIGAAVTALLGAAPMAWPRDVATESSKCPGYLDHLRNARLYLEHSDREHALAELKHARDSLRSCDQAQAAESALAARALWNRGS